MTGPPVSVAPEIASLGSAWASNSVNCVPFRHRAILDLPDGWLVAYYDAAGSVVTCRVDAAFQTRERCIIPSPVKPHDAHACISLGRGPDGDIHAVFGAHASVAWHVRLGPDCSACLAPPRPLRGAHADRLTYPMLLSRDEPPSLALLYREGGPWRGEVRVSRWDAATGTFEPDATPLLSGLTGPLSAGPYLNRPTRLRNGRMALFVVWRLPPALTAAGDVANMGIDLVLTDPDLQSMTTDNGVALQRPVTPLHGARVWAVPVGMNLMNQAAAAVAPDGSPMALTYWNDARGIPQYQLLWRTDRQWQAATISSFVTRFSLAGRGTLPLPHSRPEMLVRSDGTVLCLFRSSEYGNRLMLSVHHPPFDIPCGSPRVLLDEDLGQYEPVVDLDTFQRTGSVVVYAQFCRQAVGDAAQALHAAPAYLLRWPAPEVDTW